MQSVHVGGGAGDFVRPWGLGGSDVGAILGLSPYRSPMQVWLEKVGAIVNTGDRNEHGAEAWAPGIDAGSEAVDGESAGLTAAEGAGGGIHLRFGQHLEPFVAREYERLTGHTTHEHRSTLRHSNHRHLFAHVDRLVSTDGSGVVDVEGRVIARTLLECKTASAFNAGEWGRPWSDEVPAAYLAQCAWYTTITGCEEAHLVVLLGNSDLRIYRVMHDPALGEALVRAALSFWDDHVMTGRPPEPTTRQDVELLHPRETKGTEVQADEATLGQLRRLRRMAGLSKRLERESDAIKDRLAVLIGGSERLTHGGRTLASWRTSAPARRIDLARLRRERPELVAAYLLEGEPSRRLHLGGLTNV